MKLKKSKKSVRQRGKTNHGHGARKKWKGKGHRGGSGMAGTGKKADHKKTLINKKYGNSYFGRQGVTSRGTKKDKLLKINVGDIERNYNSLLKRYGEGDILNLSDHKVLGSGEITRKINLKVLDISKAAKEKIEKAGGNAEILTKKDEEISEPIVEETKEE
jgi:large subunit ribosomal protein L15